MSAEAKVLRVLLVEDREDDALLVVRLLQREGYAVRWRRVDGRDALREALEGEPWDVVLCDFRMPGFDAYGALEVVRAHDPDMPFVVVSGTVEEDVIVEMLRAGANDYVMKSNLTRLAAAVTREVREAEGRAKGFVGYCAAPLVARGEAIGVLEVLSRCPLPENSDWWEFLEALAGQAAVAVHNGRLVEELRRANLSLQLAYDATLAGWSRALDLRDRETEGHTQRVTELTVRLAQAMGVPEAELVHIRRGALLHDIGKLGIPDAILLKPGPLSEEEWEVMRRHPDYAFRWLAGIEFLRPALDIPYCHHERWDGGGYPHGLKGEEIPLAARIFAVVDVFDALTSDRPYRKAWSRDEALRYIHEQAGRQFDPKVVEVFLREIGAESVGSGDRPTAGP